MGLWEDLIGGGFTGLNWFLPVLIAFLATVIYAVVEAFRK